MPPRFAYWTILVGGLPTAFRAAEREELLPTFKRLREKQPDAVMRWFSRGQLWDSPDAARAALLDARRAEGPPRGRDWRPGGTHRDPRQKYIDAKKARNVDRRKQRFERRQNDDPARGPGEGPPGRLPDGPSGWKDRPRGPKPEGRRERKERPDRPAGPKPEGRREWKERPDRPSGPKPEGRREWKERPDRPSGPKPEARREWKERPDRPSGPKPEGRREWKERPDRPSGPKPEGRREWKDRPDRPSGPKPEGRREWKDRPDRPAGPKPEARREWDRPRGPRPPGKPPGGHAPGRPAGPRDQRGPRPPRGPKR